MSRVDTISLAEGTFETGLEHCLVSIFYGSFREISNFFGVLTLCFNFEMPNESLLAIFGLPSSSSLVRPVVELVVVFV